MDFIQRTLQVRRRETVERGTGRQRGAVELDGRHGWKLTAVYQHGYRLESVDVPRNPA